MITYQELLTTPEYWTTRIQLELYRIINDYINNNHLTRTELANKLGVTKGYVSQVLSGDFDHRLSKFVELSLAAGVIPKVSFIPTDKVFAKETIAEISIKGICSDKEGIPNGLKRFDKQSSSSTITYENKSIVDLTDHFCKVA